MTQTQKHMSPLAELSYYGRNSPERSSVLGHSQEQIEHEILNSRDLSKKGSADASVGIRHADREQGDRSLRSMREASLWRTRCERKS